MPPQTNLMALTATTTYETRNKIITALEMDDCRVIAMIPNNMNIIIILCCITITHFTNVHSKYIRTLIEEICAKGREAKRTIIFCKSYETLIKYY